MKQKLIATTFLLALLSAACTIGDPVIGKWKSMDSRGEIIGGDDQPYIEFLADGKYRQHNFFSGTWKRLDDSRLELHQNPAFGTFPASTRTVTVKIESNILTITESNGESTRFMR